MTIVDDYAHHPAEIAATIAAAREAFPGRRLRVLFQPHLVSRTRHLARELGAALAAADDVVVTDVYLAREAADPAVTGKLVVDALSDRGRLAGVDPGRRRRGVRTSRGGAEPGDVLLVLGAGERRRRARAASASALGRARRDRARGGRRRSRGCTTIGTGGPARWLARPETLDELEEVLGWAADRGARGRDDRARLEPARRTTTASTRSSLRLGGELAAVRVEGEMLVAGGGATNAVCLHRARDAGLGGLEFASAIPGTAGGGVRMNAGAYGSDWRAVLVDARRRRRRRARARSAGRARARLPPLGARARRGRRARCASGSTPKPAEAIKAEVAELLAQRKATQPTDEAHVRQRLQEPGRGPGRGRADRALRPEGLSGSAARVISERHANFIENAGGATSADALALMAEARRRVHERLRRRRSSTRCASSARSSCRRCREAAFRGEHREVAARTRASSRRGTGPCGHRASARAQSIAIGAGVAALVVGAYAVARETSLFAVRTIDDRAAARRGSRPRCRRALATGARAEPAPRRRGARHRPPCSTTLPDVVSVSFDRSFPNTLHVHRRGRARGAAGSPGERRAGSSRRAAG